VAFGGRALGDDQPKYLNSPETPIYIKGRILYNLDHAAAPIRKEDYAILVEGYMDCIAVASSSIENVVASCGTSLTEAQVRLLGRSSRRVVVNYDPDSAGVAATERSLALLLESGIEVKVLALPAALDPDSFVRQKGVSAYRQALSAAPTYLDYLTERAVAKHDISRPEGKVAAANLVMPYLVRIPNLMLKAELANRLAERLRLDGRLLRGELERAVREKRPEVRLPAPMATERATPAERELLRAFLENEELAGEFLKPLVEEGLCEGLATERIFRQLWDACCGGKKIDLELLESLSAEERRLAYLCLLGAREPVDRKGTLDYLHALRRRKAKLELDRLQAALKTADSEHDDHRRGELLRAKAKLQRDLGQPRGP
jgi:DNA primase